MDMHEDFSAEGDDNGDSDEWDPAPSCPACEAMLRLVEDTRPWHRGAYADWCPLCGYRQETRRGQGRTETAGFGHGESGGARTSRA